MVRGSNNAHEACMSLSTPDSAVYVPKLPQDVIEMIIDEASSDPSTLGALCRLSRDYTEATRKHLYYEIDLTTGRGDTVQRGSLPTLLTRRNRHLWKYIKSFAITLDDAENSEDNTNNPFIGAVSSMELPGLECIYIQFGPATHPGGGHFHVTEPTQSLLEKLLSSELLKAFAIDINTQWLDASAAVPCWIFWYLSHSVEKLTIKTVSSGNAALYPGDPDLLPHTPSGERRCIPEFYFATKTQPLWNQPELEDLSPSDDSLERCCTTLSKLPDLYLDFSRTRRLTLTAIWKDPQTCDPTMWEFADKAAETLEELTIHDFPSHSYQLNQQPRSLSNYKSLHTLTLSIRLTRDVRGCSALADLVPQLPPPLRRVYVQVNLGTVYGRDMSSDDVLCGPLHSSWREFDGALNSRSTLSFVSVELLWYSESTPSVEGGSDWWVTPGTPDPAIIKRDLKRRVKTMLWRWRAVFIATRARGIFNLKYTHHVVPQWLL